jgi:hypothetical protein
MTVLLRRPFTVSSVLSNTRMERRQLRRKEASPLETAFKFNDDLEDNAKRYKYNPKDYDVPELRNIDKRWKTMDALDQEDIQLYLEDRMRSDWRDLSDDEKKAIWFINYGAWGPRASNPDKPERIYGYYVWLIVGTMAAATAYKFGSEKVNSNDNNEHENKQ